MKIKEISLRNFMKYSEVTCSFDENITYLVGPNGSGKSTLAITGVQAILQGIAEKATNGTTPVFGERFRFIGPKAATSINQIILIDEIRGNAEIKVTRKITKSGSELSIVGPEDYGQLDQAWLNNLFNVFMIAPKEFQRLSPKEQANALGIDTSPFDKEIADLKVKHTAINQAINIIGKLDELEEVKEVDVQALQGHKEDIRKAMAIVYRQNQATNKAIREAWEADKKAVDEECRLHNLAIEETLEARRQVKEYHAALVEIRSNLGSLSDMVDFSRLTTLIENFGPIAEKKNAIDLYPAEPTNLSDQLADYVPAENERVYIREIPDDTALKSIDQEIADASETNRKALLYSQYLEKKKARDAKEEELAENKRQQQAKADERLTYIKNFKFPFSNLMVDDDGQLLMNGRPLKEPHFSTGEMLKIIPILISTAKPDLKYVFLQDFNLMDEDKQSDVEKYLTEQGFQLVIEYVGKKKLTDKNCILLKDNVIVEDFDRVMSGIESLKVHLTNLK